MPRLAVYLRPCTPINYATSKTPIYLAPGPNAIGSLSPALT